jgi:hypothetical protein
MFLVAAAAIALRVTDTRGDQHPTVTEAAGSAPA